MLACILVAINVPAAWINVTTSTVLERLANELIADVAKVLIEAPALANVSGNVPRLVLSDDRAVGRDCIATLAN